MKGYPEETSKRSGQISPVCGIKTIIKPVYDDYGRVFLVLWKNSTYDLNMRRMSYNFETAYLSELILLSVDGIDPEVLRTSYVKNHRSILYIYVQLFLSKTTLKNSRWTSKVFIHFLNMYDSVYLSFP